MMIALLALIANAGAEEGKSSDKNERFNERKAKVIEQMNKKIGLLQNALSCIHSAADKEALKACRENHRVKMEAMREERGQHHREK